jgi:hypothetical protein
VVTAVDRRIGAGFEPAGDHEVTAPRDSRSL